MNSIERRRPPSAATAKPAGWLDRRRTIAGPGFNRWRVPPAALAIHLSIGMAYGFSVFWLPLSKDLPGIAACGADASWITVLTGHCNWPVEWVSVTFMLFTAVLGLAAAVWGEWAERVGPRKATAVAALCWSGGLTLGAVALQIHQLWLFWLGVGVIGGIGLGLGYISPISTLVRWFPDRRGLATGMAVMGFGGGALIGAPLAVMLMKHFQTSVHSGAGAAIVCLAMIYGSCMLGGAFAYRLPPRGWRPEGWTPSVDQSATHQRGVHVAQAWKTPAFWCIWGVLCLNVSAGIGVLSMASPILQEIFGGRLIGLSAPFEQLNDPQRARISIIAVGFTGLLALFNISGRFFWALVSDRLGCKQTFHCFFLLGIPLYAAIPTLSAHTSVGLFMADLSILVSIFGGGFAVLPAYLSELFGDEMVGAIQGRVLTAWSTAGIVGPVVLNTMRRHALDHSISMSESYNPAFYVFAGFMVLGLACNHSVRPVARRHFMTVDQIDEYHHSLRVPVGSDRTALARAVAPTQLPIGLVSAWLAVCTPIVWGVCIAVSRVLVFL